MDSNHRRLQRRPDASPSELRRSHQRAGVPTERDRAWKTFWRWETREGEVWARAARFLYSWLGELDPSEPDAIAAARDQWVFEAWSRKPRSYLQRRQSRSSDSLKKAHRVVDAAALEGYGLTACGEVVPLGPVDWRRMGETRNDTDPCSRCLTSGRPHAMSNLLVACERAGSPFPQGTAWEPRVLRALSVTDPALASRRLDSH